MWTYQLMIKGKENTNEHNRIVQPWRNFGSWHIRASIHSFWESVSSSIKLLTFPIPYHRLRGIVPHFTVGWKWRGNFCINLYLVMGQGLSPALAWPIANFPYKIFTIFGPLCASDNTVVPTYILHARIARVYKNVILLAAYFTAISKMYWYKFYQAWQPIFIPKIHSHKVETQVWFW